MKFRFAAITLCVLMTIIFVLQNMFDITNQLLLTKDVWNAPWTLVSSVFIHGSMGHLLGNIFALGLFGSILERIEGTKKFLILFFVSGIVTGITSSFFYDAALGASGAIFGVLGMLAAIRPKMIVWTYGVPMPMFVAAGFWLVLDIAGTFYPTNIANLAHISGLIFGIVVGITQRKPHAKEKKPLADEDIDEWENQWMS